MGHGWEGEGENWEVAGGGLLLRWVWRGLGVTRNERERENEDKQKETGSCKEVDKMRNWRMMRNGRMKNVFGNVVSVEMSIS